MIREMLILSEFGVSPEILLINPSINIHSTPPLENMYRTQFLVSYLSIFSRYHDLFLKE